MKNYAKLAIAGFVSSSLLLYAAATWQLKINKESEQKDKFPVTGTVVVSVGSVLQKYSYNVIWQNLQIGDAIYEEHIVRTGKNSQLIVSLVQDKLDLLLNEDTAILIRKDEICDDLAPNSYQMQVLSGVVRLIYQKKEWQMRDGNIYCYDISGPININDY